MPTASRSGTGTRLSLLLSPLAWASLSAGALWLVTGWLNGWLRHTAWLLPAEATNAVLPKNLVSQMWQEPMPWSAVVSVASAALVMVVVWLIGATAGGSWVVGPRRSSQGAEPTTEYRGPSAAGAPLFYPVWFACVLASSLGAVGAEVGRLPHSMWTPTGAETAAALTSAAMAGAYWGLVLGWLPGLVAVLRRRSSSALGLPTPPRRPVLVQAVIGAGVLALLLTAGVGRGTSGIGALGWHPSPAPAAVEATLPPTPVPVPAPTSAPDETSPDVDPSWCRLDQLTLTHGGLDAALGARSMALLATNTSTESCVLEGYPQIGFGAAGERFEEVAVEHGASYAGFDDGGVPVTLGPGDQAVSWLGWRSNAAAGSTRADTLYLAPYAGAPETALRTGQDPDYGIDVVATDTVTVNAWSLNTSSDS